MTDGCGYINTAALTQIARYMCYESAPTAIQARIDGAKGLWLRHPTDTSNEPKIWIRDSQNKIKNPKFDRAHRILELCGPSRATTNVALTQQSILNIVENGVPHDVVVKLFHEGLTDEITPLLKWDSPVLLCDAVWKAGGLAGARISRLAGGASVAMGLARKSWKEDDESDDDVDSAEELTYTGRNQHSGGEHQLVISC